MVPEQNRLLRDEGDLEVGADRLRPLAGEYPRQLGIHLIELSLGLPFACALGGPRLQE